MASTKGPEPAPLAGPSSSAHLGPMLSRSRRPSAFVTDGDVQAIKVIIRIFSQGNPKDANEETILAQCKHFPDSPGE
ncbi:hypothetical protein RRG08_060151 [Elysia crispata]|uniref:Uncharacterized protein n=1 Tax=Elysia crispata TaxID=231223 RepID=A0AAE0ZYW9_9GAST|nr:hypothetical protein RRG08_060151 [Elysia crispata]